MKIKKDLLFPAELTPGDEIWGTHEGHDDWVRVVAICSGDQELLVWCDAAARPLHLPATRRVQAKHVVADFMTQDAEAQEAADFEARIAGWYSGDLDAATSAAAARRNHPAPDHVDDGIKLGRKLHEFYSGDLSCVCCMGREHG